jgi:hypothetical protein
VVERVPGVNDAVDAVHKDLDCLDDIAECSSQSLFLVVIELAPEVPRLNSVRFVMVNVV